MAPCPCRFTLARWTSPISRAALLLGAQRIGHGVNLIHDPDTMLALRGGDTLVEINLISNLLLNYVDRYEDHPFPEYLRFGIHVALSTDDRGMWDSALTDEFFVAVKHFDLSFEEVVALSRASLTHSFLPEVEKARLLADYDDALARFVARFLSGGLGAAAPEAHPPYRFICRRYGLCPRVRPMMRPLLFILATVLAAPGLAAFARGLPTRGLL